MLCSCWADARIPGNVSKDGASSMFFCIGPSPKVLLTNLMGLCLGNCFGLLPGPPPSRLSDVWHDRSYSGEGCGGCWEASSSQAPQRMELGAGPLPRSSNQRSLLSFFEYRLFVKFQRCLRLPWQPTQQQQQKSCFLISSTINLDPSHWAPTSHEKGQGKGQRRVATSN
jgi:hypothetical protein